MDDIPQDQSAEQQQSQQNQPQQSSGARNAMQIAKKARQMQKAAKTARLAVAAATSETVIIPVILLLANKKNAKRLLYVILGIIILIIILFGASIDEDQDQNVTVLLQKSAPPQVDNDKPINYALNVSYTGNPTQIIVTDPIPDNATFVSAGQNAVTLDASGQPTSDPALVKTVKWTIAVSSSTNGTISTGATSLAGFFTESAQTYNVPVALLMAINKLEAPGVLDTWTDADVAKFSVINWWFTATPDDRTRGWAFNQCDTMACANGSDVQGIMQFEIATWDWVGAGLTFSDGHTPNRLYPKDAIYAAGNLVRIHAAEYDAAYGTQATDWPEDKVRKVATAYCTGNIYGDPSSSACTGGGGPYDDVVWGYYQEFLSK